MGFKKGSKLYDDELNWVLELMYNSEQTLVEQLSVIVSSACVNECFCYLRTPLIALADASRYRLIDPSLCALCNARELVRDFIRNDALNEAYFEEYTKIRRHPAYREDM